MKELKETLIKISPGNKAGSTYPWWRPEQIPKNFESAVNDILEGINEGGERLLFVSQMGGMLHHIPQVFLNYYSLYYKLCNKISKIVIFKKKSVDS